MRFSFLNSGIVYRSCEPHRIWVKYNTSHHHLLYYIRETWSGSKDLEYKKTHWHEEQGGLGFTWRWFLWLTNGQIEGA